MKKDLKKLKAFVLALSTIPATGCTIKIDETKLIDKLGELGIEISMDKDNIEITANETTIPQTNVTTSNNETTSTTINTTYQTEISSNTTNTTYQTEISNNTTTNVKTTEQTTQANTTTETTTILSNNEPIMVEQLENYTFDNKYLISDEYTVKGENSTVSCKGEGLYSIVVKLNGKFDENIAKKIKELNTLNEDFIEEGTILKVPFTIVYYKGSSIQEIAQETEVSESYIKKVNNIIDPNEKLEEETKIIIQVLEQGQKTYKTITGQTQNIIGNTVIKGENLIECKNTYTEGSNTSVICLYKTGKNTNVVEYVEINTNGSISGCVLAKNVNYITKTEEHPVIICNSEADMYVKKLEDNDAFDEEYYRTKINKQNFTNEYYMYKSENGEIAVALSNLDIPGFKQYNIIGGKQKTIG